MVDLRVLALSKNRIQTVPVLIKELRSLEVLLLDRNAIASIPSEIGDLESLVELDVSYNRITSLPDEICGMDSLRFIRIQENPRIRDLPKSMMNLRRLRYIQCDEALRADFTQYNHLDYNSVFPTEMRYKYLIGRMPAFKVSSFVCRPISPFARLSVRLRLRRCAVARCVPRRSVADRPRRVLSSSPPRRCLRTAQYVPIAGRCSASLRRVRLYSRRPPRRCCETRTSSTRKWPSGTRKSSFATAV